MLNRARLDDLGLAERPSTEIVQGAHAAGRLTLHDRAETMSSCAVCTGDIVVPFELNGGTHIQFEVIISGQTIPAILDTGSGRTGMNRLAAKAIGIDLPPAQP